MSLNLFRIFLFSAALSSAALLAPVSLRAAEPAAKTDESGWILPANLGTGWHIRLKDARAEAAKDDKPILIVFSGPDWGSSSKKFETTVLKSKEFQSAVRPSAACLYIQHFVNVSAPEDQVSSNQSLRKALSVPAVYPCTVVLGSDGKKLLGIIPGAPDRKTYFQKISKLTGIAVPE